MGNLYRRVDRLEKEGHGKGNSLLVWKDKGESKEAAIKRRGFEPTEHDTVHFVGWGGAFDGET